MTDDTKNPFEAMTEMWTTMAKGYTDMVRPFWEAVLEGSAAKGAELLWSTLERPPDPTRVQQLWKSALEEYRADFETLSDGAMKVDYTPITRAWASLTTGREDEESRKAVERFLEVSATKTRYGSEYFADPEKTEVAPTARELVHQAGPLDLFRYDPGPDAAERSGTPLLLVYSLINKPYILDLMEGYSFVRHLLDRGLDVYVFEWREDERRESDVTLDQFVDELIDDCVDWIRDRTGADQVSLLGHCMGGPFAALYTALHQDKVERLMTLTAPFTANEGGVVAMWTDRELFAVDAVVDRYGYIPGKAIRYIFLTFKPYMEAMKWKMFMENIGNEQVMKLFFAADKWVNDSVDVPGESFRQLMVEIYKEDRLRSGGTVLNDKKVDLAAITCPVLSMAAARDWLVSPASARIFNELVSSEDVRYEEIPGGHVALFIDPRVAGQWQNISDFFLESAGAE
jgi:polyhydroxyalkanoate synthase